jgi:hypothetical protein
MQKTMDGLRFAIADYTPGLESFLHRSKGCAIVYIWNVALICKNSLLLSIVCVIFRVRLLPSVRFFFIVIAYFLSNVISASGVPAAARSAGHDRQDARRPSGRSGRSGVPTTVARWLRDVTDV